MAILSWSMIIRLNSGSKSSAARRPMTSSRLCRRTGRPSNRSTMAAVLAVAVFAVATSPSTTPVSAATSSTDIGRRQLPVRLGVHDKNVDRSGTTTSTTSTGHVDDDDVVANLYRRQQQQQQLVIDGGSFATATNRASVSAKRTRRDNSTDDVIGAHTAADAISSLDNVTRGAALPSIVVDIRVVSSRRADNTTGSAIVSVSAKSVDGRLWRSKSLTQRPKLQPPTSTSMTSSSYDTSVRPSAAETTVRPSSSTSPAAAASYPLEPRSMPHRPQAPIPEVPMMDGAASAAVVKPAGINAMPKAADVIAPSTMKSSTANVTLRRRTGINNSSSAASAVDQDGAVSTIAESSFRPTDDDSNDEDGGWNSVAELLREVGHQLTGLRSFVRRLRTDNAAVYRDVVGSTLATRRRLNGARGGGRAWTTRVPRCRKQSYDDDDDDAGDYDEEEDEGERDKEKDVVEEDDVEFDRQQSLTTERPTTNVETESENDRNRERNVVDFRRHRHGHVARARGNVARCSPGFSRASTGTGCFRLFTDRVTWSAARDRCAAGGTRLAAILSAADQRHLADVARNSYDTAHCDFWIGLTKQLRPADGRRSSRTRQRARFRNNGQRRRSRDDRPTLQKSGTSGTSGWYWTTASSETDIEDRHRTASLPDRGRSSAARRTPMTISYTNWNDGEPNDSGGGGQERCVEALWVFGWKWNDARCDGPSTACYVCQADPVNDEQD